MRVALTGATGFLGRHVIDALHAQSHTVLALARPRAEPLAAAPGLEWSEGALTDVDSLDRLAGGADAIVHAAFSEDAESFVDANVRGTLRLLTAAARERKPFVFTSSLAVYGHDPNSDPRGERFRRDEDFPLWPSDVYGAHKAALEKLIVAAGASLGVPVVVLRLGWVLGVQERWDKNAFAPQVDDAVEHGELRTPRGGYVVDVQDAAELLVRSLSDAGLSGSVYNTFDRWLDFAEVAQPLGALLSRSIDVACPASLPPHTPIENGRLLERGVTFRTDERVRAMLGELIRRKKDEA